MSFLDIVSKFNQQADSHTKSQSLNPFSEQFVQSRSPSPRFSREEYGKPIAGSKTDLRGRKAKSHICREILELCTVIHDVGTYNAKKRDPDDDDGTIIVSFGELFQIYTKISDKVVGLLIAAKRRGFVYFDREILFQRRDDDVLIALLKPISEISKILKEDINQANGVSAAPVELPQQPVEKKKPNKTKRVKPKCDNEHHHNHSVEETRVDAIAVETEVDGDGKTDNDGSSLAKEHLIAISDGVVEIQVVGDGENDNDENGRADEQLDAAAEGIVEIQVEGAGEKEELYDVRGARNEMNNAEYGGGRKTNCEETDSGIVGEETAAVTNGVVDVLDKTENDVVRTGVNGVEPKEVDESAGPMVEEKGDEQPIDHDYTTEE